MGHRAAARSLLAIAAKLPSLSAAEHTQKARWSVIGWGNPRSVQTNQPWHGLKITKLPVPKRVLEKKKKRPMAPENSKSRNRLGTGKAVFRRFRKHFPESDLAKRLRSVARRDKPGYAEYLGTLASTKFHTLSST